MKHECDIVIFGAGIAGLWLHNRLSGEGYNSLLLESNAMGGGQSIASQGIIHSGLKYAFGGKINALAKSISAMPDLWRAALKGEGPVDLSQAKVNASSQYLLVPGGLMAELVKLVTKQALGKAVRDVPQKDWPDSIRKSGFQGTVIFMDEPVLDVPSVVRALAEPYKDCIRKISALPVINQDEYGDIESIEIEGHQIRAKAFIFTAAGSNKKIAKKLQHDKGLETQARPLLMGIMKNAPHEIYAHCVGTSDKPVVTITTHKNKDGSLSWYLGGAVAERKKNDDPKAVVKAATDAFKKYMPALDLGQVEWTVFGINRIEGKSTTQGWMPDTPTLHCAGNALYAWPTKLTFAPLLSDMIQERLASITPMRVSGDWSFLPPAEYAATPWDNAVWSQNLKNDSSDEQGY